MTNILDSLAKARGPARELDWLVAQALDFPEKWPDTINWPPFAEGSPYDKKIPEFTKSINACLDLVSFALPGYWWRISASNVCELHGPEFGDHDAESWGETVCLGILITLFKVIEKRKKL